MSKRAQLTGTIYLIEYLPPRARKWRPCEIGHTTTPEKLDGWLEVQRRSYPDHKYNIVRYRRAGVVR